ncbi:MAG: hypothetical protein U0271_27950 [Polyangiaceae bacterium]
MLDVLCIALYARSRGKVAEGKGHPTSAGITPTVVLGLGLEIAGAVAGFSLIGKAGLFAFGLLGLAIGLFLATLWVARLPDIRLAIHPSAGQVAGADCVECSERIILESEGLACKRCEAPVHRHCRAAHRKRLHPKRQSARVDAAA